MALLFFLMFIVVFLVLLVLVAVTKQPNLDQVAKGTILFIETQTFTGSYGFRYTKEVITYEFQDASGHRWRGRTATDSLMNLKEGSEVTVFYEKEKPFNNKAIV